MYNDKACIKEAFGHGHTTAQGKDSRLLHSTLAFCFSWFPFRFFHSRTVGFSCIPWPILCIITHWGEGEK
jgi:hypothetical protein